MLRMMHARRWWCVTKSIILSFTMQMLSRDDLYMYYLFCISTQLDVHFLVICVKNCATRRFPFVSHYFHSLPLNVACVPMLLHVFVFGLDKKNKHTLWAKIYSTTWLNLMLRFVLWSLLLCFYYFIAFISLWVRSFYARKTWVFLKFSLFIVCCSLAFVHIKTKSVPEVKE